MPNLNHRLFTAVLVFCASPTFAATTYAPGYWLDNDICTECGDAQYYCPGDNIRHSVTRGYYSTGGTQTTRTGNGTNVPLYQEKMSVPALNIQLESGQVCYGALATGVGKLNIEYDNQIYHAIE